jgi:hypothetical protein
MCPIQLQPLFGLLDLPDGVFWKAMVMKHLLVSDHSEEDLHDTDVNLTRTDRLSTVYLA